MSNEVFWHTVGIDNIIEFISCIKFTGYRKLDSFTTIKVY